MFVNLLYSADKGSAGGDDHSHHDHHHTHAHGDHHHHDHDHDHDHDEELESVVITMVDEETNEEYEFVIADDFEFEGEVYCVLVTQEDDPEAVIVRVVTMEDGTEGFQSLDDDEFDRVAAEYDRLVEEAGFESDEDGDE